MFKNHPLIIIFAAGFILLLSGIGTSYYWLTRIYIPEQINSNENAKKLVEWTENDTFNPSNNNKITEIQLERFIKINKTLYALLIKLKKDYSDSQWQTIVEMVKMQPAWKAQKYLALKKYQMSPKEYEYINDQIRKHWILRFKEKSAEQLKEMGWEMFEDRLDSTNRSENYDLFSLREDQLNSIFTLFLSDEVKNLLSDVDSLSTNSDSLP
jgi:hypothetical protein